MELPAFDLRLHLKAWRQHARLTQPELAKRLEVSQGTIGNYEGTKTPRDLSLGMAEKIAHALGITLAQFIGTLPPTKFGTGEPPRRYVVTSPGDPATSGRVGRVVDKLNRALELGVDAKLLDILEMLIEREIAALPVKGN